MQKTLIYIVLSLALAAPAASAVNTGLTEITGWYAVYDTPEGVVTEIVPASDAFASCGGTAPVVSSCVNTGVRVFGATHGFAFPIFAPAGKIVFVGHGLSSLAGSDGRTRDFHCDFVRVDTQAPAAPVNACAGSGTFPSVGSALTQTVTMSGYNVRQGPAVGEWLGTLTT